MNELTKRGRKLIGVALIVCVVATGLTAVASEGARALGAVVGLVALLAGGVGVGVLVVGLVRRR